MTKRGQISSQVLVYALSIAVVGTILIMGYKYMASSKKVIDRSELLQLQNKLISDMKAIGKDYGAYKKIFYSVPRNLDEVCFVDLSKKDQILSSKLISFYPVIKDSLNSNLSKNIFFIGSAEQSSSYAQNIKMNHYPFINCFHQKNGKFEMGVEGLGGSNALILADFITTARIDEHGATTLKSSDELVTLELSKETETNTDHITIEVVEPTSSDFEKGASDVYKFGPSGATFNPPAKLNIKYNPSIVGECPSTLNFNQFSEDGTKKNVIPAKHIDCKNSLAIFDISEFI